MKQRWRDVWTVVGEGFVILWALAIVIGFGYCVVQLPRNCREVTPQYWECE